MTMNTDYLKTFVNTLVYNIVTIVAVVVAVVGYTYRATTVWYNNGGREFLITTACKTVMFVNKTAERVYYTLEDAETTKV